MAEEPWTDVDFFGINVGSIFFWLYVYHKYILRIYQMLNVFYSVAP